MNRLIQGLLSMALILLIVRHGLLVYREIGRYNIDGNASQRERGLLTRTVV